MCIECGKGQIDNFETGLCKECEEELKICTACNKEMKYPALAYVKVIDNEKVARGHFECVYTTQIQLN
jgi:hypothetical protein